MALSPAYSISNNDSVTSEFVLTDLSTGSDSSISTRQLLLYDVSNTLVATVPFPLSAGNSITPSILTEDYAYNSVMQWLDSGGNVLYTLSQIGCFTGFLEWFFYSLIQYLSAQPNVINDTEYLQQMSNLELFINSANKAITTGQSIFNSQQMILLGQDIQANQQLIF